MTPKLRREINEACDIKILELSDCEDNPYVQMVRTLYEIQRNLLTSLPDGYLIPFKECNER
jgi:hypothetical protein